MKEMPRAGWLKYLLVIIYQFIGCLEAFPVASVTFSSVIKISLEQIIPRHGIIEAIDSDIGTHFTGKVLWGETKKHFLKPVVETCFPWARLLPLALAQRRAKCRGI